MTFEQYIAEKMPLFDLADDSIEVDGRFLREIWETAQSCLLSEAIRKVSKENQVPCVIITAEELAAMDADMAGLRVWLDDVRKKPEGYDIHVKTADEAINLIAEGRVSYMSFDHDLGYDSEVMAPPTCKSGYDVAKYVEEGAANGTIMRFKWDIHSMNPEGRTKIAMAMRNADKFWDQAK